MNSVQCLSAIRDNMKKAVVGKDEVIDELLIALICSGHVLVEDLPGLGKTTLVSALASSLGCSFQRIQFTPDVLPVRYHRLQYGAAADRRTGLPSRQCASSDHTGG